MTPTPHLQNQKALIDHKLEYKLSWAEIDSFRNEILRTNKTKPVLGRKTGSCTFLTELMLYFDR